MHQTNRYFQIGCQQQSPSSSQDASASDTVNHTGTIGFNRLPASRLVCWYQSKSVISEILPNCPNQWG